MTAACGVPEQFLMLIADLAGQAAQDRAVTVEIEQRQFRLDRKLRPLALGRTGIERVGAFKLVRVKAVQCYPQPKIIFVAGVDQVMGDMRSEERRVGKECVSMFSSRWSP